MAQTAHLYIFTTVTSDNNRKMTTTSPHKKIGTEHPGQYILSIRLERDNIYFSVHNPAVDNSFQSCKSRFPSGKECLPALENFVYEHPELLQPYKKTYIILPSERFTFVPRNLEPSGETAPYYTYCFPGTSEKILENCLEYNQIYNLFGIEADLYAFLVRTFEQPIILHHLSPLCEYFYSKSRINGNEKMYVNIESNRLDIVCFNAQGLLFANTFEYRRPHDAVYYILNVWQQLTFDQQKGEIHLTGSNRLKKPIVPVIQEYISCVIPSIFPAQLFKIGKETLNAPFDLIVTPLCGL